MVCDKVVCDKAVRRRWRRRRRRRRRTGGGADGIPEQKQDPHKKMRGTIR